MIISPFVCFGFFFYLKKCSLICFVLFCFNVGTGDNVVVEFLELQGLLIDNPISFVCFVNNKLKYLEIF